MTIPSGEQTRLPLSFGQEQLWFLDQFSPGQTTYNVATAHRLRGRLDVDTLGTCLSRVLQRHEQLRATFHAVDGTPYASIGAGAAAPLSIVDLSDLPPDDRAQAAEKALADDVGTPFDLTTGPLYRFRLLRLGPREHILSLVLHHIVTDGWSMGVLNAELATTYRTMLDGAGSALDEPPARYADYVERQRQLIRDGELEQQLQFWQKQLASLPALELPTDRPRPAEQSFRGDLVTVDVPADVVADVGRLAHDQGTSTFAVLAAALAVVLHRYSGQDDIPVGMATLGRPEPEWEQLVGFFTTMVVLRTDLAGDPTFTELLDRVAEVIFDAYDNQDAPFERVVDRVQPVRDPSRNPLFQVAIQMLADSNSGANLDLPGLDTETVEPPAGGARFDLALTFVESAGVMRLRAEYATDLFDRWRIEALVRHLVQVLRGVCADPRLPLLGIPLLTDQERDELLEAGRGEFLSYGPEPVHAVIARRAAGQPDHPAAVFEGSVLTYGELDRRADRLARYLRAQGIGHQQIVAVAAERGLDTLVSLLGVLKAGAAFAILDPSHPVGRLEFILRDTGASLVLTQAAVRNRLPESADWRVLCVDADWPVVESTTSADAPLAEWADRNSLAYVLYTSGSTGKPKGVVIEHRALMSFVESYRRTFDLEPADRMLQLAALAFDMSQGEIFTGLAVGATLVLVPKEAGRAPETLAALMRDEQVTYICMSPAMLSLVEAGPYPHLRKIMAGGEAVPAEVVNKWNLPGRRLVNVYGPTEAAVGCTAYECEHRVWRSAPPIGQPYPDRRMYVVDRRDNLVPRGVPGELLIGGPEGLARGYLNRPELTADRFTDDPFRPDGRVYRSGDLVRWNARYQLEFLGRLDNQIKLRGLRIELEEIESALLSHPEVGTSAAALRPDRRGDLQIVGYVTAGAGTPPQPAELHRYLAERLPEYMIPTAWVVLDRMPLTTARKVDRAALPMPALPDLSDEFVAPATPTEQRVADIIAEVLAADRVGAEDRFFDIGGNSLQAMRVVSRLNRSFGVRISVRTLFGSATVRAVAGTIDGLRADRADAGTG